MTGKETAMDWNGRRVLVTGGAGFLGANLCHALAARGARVTALDGFLFGGGANPANLDGQYNYLLANGGNANFYSAGVEPGDIVRYYVNVDEESAERGIDQKAAALELRVRRLDSRHP